MATNLKLNQKIQELKKRAGLVNYQDTPINERAKSARADASYYKKKLDERVICGYMLSFGNRNHHGESFVKGSAARSIEVRGPGSDSNYQAAFLWQHRQDDPLATHAVVEEDDFGVYFETKPLDEHVPNAERALSQTRSGTLNQFSIGFDYVYDKIEYREKDDTLIIFDFEWYENSIVTIGSDSHTKALRNFETINNLQDEIQEFILTLPKKDRAIARELFTRQKGLIDLDQFVEEKKEERGIDYTWLTSEIKNLKF